MRIKRLPPSIEVKIDDSFLENWRAVRQLSSFHPICDLICDAPTWDTRDTIYVPPNKCQSQMSIKLKLEALKRYETNLQMARKSFEIDMAYSLRYPVISNNLESIVVCKTVGLIAMDRRQIAAANVFKNRKAAALQVYKTDLKDLEPKRKPSVYFT